MEKLKHKAGVSYRWYSVMWEKYTHIFLLHQPDLDSDVNSVLRDLYFMGKGTVQHDFLSL